MACYTQQEIAEIVGCHQTVVGEVLREMAELPKSLKPAAEHITGFEIPIYNVWKFKEKTSGSEHFGNSEPGIVDNLLYYYRFIKAPT